MADRPIADGATEDGPIIVRPAPAGSNAGAARVHRPVPPRPEALGPRPVVRDPAIPFALVGLVLVALAIRAAGFLAAATFAGGIDAAITSWDSVFYLGIAERGYPPGTPLETAAPWAFFPVWPAILAVLVRLPVDLPVAVVGWGLVLTVVNVLLVVRLLEPRIGAREAGIVALAFAAWPPNWVHLAPYSEPLFVALELSLLLAIGGKRPLTVTLLAFVIGLARPQGAFWALAAALWLFRDEGARIAPGERLAAHVGRVLLPAIALSGAAIWQLVVSVVTGIPGGWFAIEKLPGWEMGFGILPFTTAFDALLGLLQGRVDRGLAMVPVVVIVLGLVVGLARRRESLVGRWPTVVVALNALFVSGGIGGIPRFVGGAPLLFLGITGSIAGRPVRELLFLATLVAGSVAFAYYNFAPWGSNP